MYVLTSHRNLLRRGEEFTYDLKNLKRATIVGETTGGGAASGRGTPITAHFDIAVPVARPINPVTKTDWEGTGITPDYKTSRERALPTATASSPRPSSRRRTMHLPPAIQPLRHGKPCGCLVSRRAEDLGRIQRSPFAPKRSELSSIEEPRQEFWLD